MKTMVKIERPIVRETSVFSSDGRAIVVTLYPEHIELHLKGTRDSYTVNYKALFVLGVTQAEDAKLCGAAVTVMPSQPHSDSKTS